jgi:hypothetical protein
MLHSLLQFTTEEMIKQVELFEFLYAKCREDHDLLAMIVDEYIVSLSDSKLIELEDFLTNNFGDD